MLGPATNAGLTGIAPGLGDNNLCSAPNVGRVTVVRHNGKAGLGQEDAEKAGEWVRKGQGKGGSEKLFRDAGETREG